MGGATAFDDESGFALQESEARTVVLVGRTGNGKSATGNSILGRKGFKSKFCSSGVTSKCELQTTRLKGGQIVNVIDTPGLFDFNGDPGNIGREIVNCVEMAENGIHAVLVVLSLKNRFSREEKDSVRYVLKFFGSKVSDYMIVVLTGGDELEEDEVSLEDYMGPDCPEPLKDVLEICGDRYIVFNNRTIDERKKFEQLNRLLILVGEVLGKNGGRPYTVDQVLQMKKDVKPLDDDGPLLYGSGVEVQDIKKITEMVESKVEEKTGVLKQHLVEEKAARLKAEKKAKAAQLKSDEEMKRLKQNLDKARRETEMLRNRPQHVPPPPPFSNCSIM